MSAVPVHFLRTKGDLDALSFTDDESVPENVVLACQTRELLAEATERLKQIREQYTTIMFHVACLEHEGLQGGHKTIYVTQDSNEQCAYALAVQGDHAPNANPQALQTYADISSESEHRLQLHNFGTLPDQPEKYWLLHPLHKGQRLSELPAEALSLDEYINVLMQTGTDLAELHAAGLVHRDPKPQNILFDVHNDVTGVLSPTVLMDVDPVDTFRVADTNYQAIGTYPQPPEMTREGEGLKELRTVSGAADMWNMPLFQRLVTYDQHLPDEDRLPLQAASHNPSPRGMHPSTLQYLYLLHESCTPTDPCQRPTAVEYVASLQQLQKYRKDHANEAEEQLFLLTRKMREQLSRPDPDIEIISQLLSEYSQISLPNHAPHHQAMLKAQVARLYQMFAEKCEYDQVDFAIDEAEKLLRACISLDPDNGYIYAYRMGKLLDVADTRSSTVLQDSDWYNTATIATQSYQFDRIIRNAIHPSIDALLEERTSYYANQMQDESIDFCLSRPNHSFALTHLPPDAAQQSQIILYTILRNRVDELAQADTHSMESNPGVRTLCLKHTQEALACSDILLHLGGNTIPSKYLLLRAEVFKFAGFFCSQSADIFQHANATANELYEDVMTTRQCNAEDMLHAVQQLRGVADPLTLIQRMESVEWTDRDATFVLLLANLYADRNERGESNRLIEEAYLREPHNQVATERLFEIIFEKIDLNHRQIMHVYTKCCSFGSSGTQQVMREGMDSSLNLGKWNTIEKADAEEFHRAWKELDSSEAPDQWYLRLSHERGWVDEAWDVVPRGSMRPEVQEVFRELSNISHYDRAQEVTVGSTVPTLLNNAESCIVRMHRDPEKDAHIHGSDTVTISHDQRQHILEHGTATPISYIRATKDRSNSMCIPIDNKGNVLAIEWDGSPDTLTDDYHKIIQLAGTLRSIEQVSHVEQLRMLGGFQEKCLPKEALKISGYKLDAQWRMNTIGGDLYGWSHLDETRVRTFLMDTCGHDAAAAPYQMTISTYTWLLSQNRIGEIPVALSEFVQECNGIFHAKLEQLEEGSKFATGIFCDLDHEKNVLHMASMGHPHPIRIRNGEAEQVEMKGNLPIGMIDYIGDVDVYSIGLDPGDRIVLYTDGFDETMMHDGEVFGIERVIQLCKETYHLDPSEAKKVMIRHMEQYHLFDDLSVLILHRDKE